MTAELMASIIMLVYLMVLILALALPTAILNVVCLWHLLAKAGEPGWKCLVPVYGYYTQFRLFWNKGWFVAWIVTYILSSIVSLAIEEAEEAVFVFSAMGFVISIFSLVLGIRFTLMLARSFGRTGKFAVGLIFLPIVFMPMLAFGPDKYVGPGGIPMEEPVIPDMPDPSEAIEETMPVPELPEPPEGTEESGSIQTPEDDEKPE